MSLTLSRAGWSLIQIVVASSLTVIISLFVMVKLLGSIIKHLNMWLFFTPQVPKIYTDSSIPSLRHPNPLSYQSKPFSLQLLGAT